MAAFEPAASHLAMVEIAFAGELDVAEEATMSAALEAAIPPGDPVCVVVDMSAVTFMDSTAVNTIVRARRAVQNVGGELVLRGMLPRQRRLLEVMGLGELVVE